MPGALVFKRGRSFSSAPRSFSSAPALHNRENSLDILSLSAIMITNQGGKLP